MIGVGFTWNIFDGLDREKRIRQARLTSQSLAIGKEKAVTDLQVGVDKFYSQMQNAMDNVKALNTTLEMSNELVRIREKSFKEGMATSSDVVDAEVVLSKVKTASCSPTTNTMWRLPISCPFVVFPKLSTNTGWTVKQRSYKHKTV